MLARNHPDRIRIIFDDHRLVANAGLLLPATLAQHLGLGECQGRRESVPPRAIGQRKGPRQLFREDVTPTAVAADRQGN